MTAYLELTPDGKIIVTNDCAFGEAIEGCYFLSGDCLVSVVVHAFAGSCQFVHGIVVANCVSSARARAKLIAVNANTSKQ